MTIQAIGTTGLALYLTPCDLRARGITPKELDLTQVIALTREACQSAGLTLPDLLEIEAYPDEAGVLVFAQLRPAPPLLLSFSSLPDLLNALALLPEPPKAAHATYWDGRYYLLLPTQSEETAVRLAEFGTQESCSLLPSLLTEQGEPLIPTGGLLPLYQAIRA